MSRNIIFESALPAEISINKKNPNTVRFITVLQEANKPNRNGRIYPKAVLEKALNSAYVRERLETKSWFVECGHPLDTSVQRQMTIDQRNIAAIINRIWWEGDLLKGELETADTAVGRDIKGLIEQGCRVAFSLRAQGNVHTNPADGMVYVDEPLQICTYDLVVNPSHAKAFMERICEETVHALYKSNKAGLTASILTESEDLFMNGMIIDTENTTTLTECDYTKTYTSKFKKLEEMYVPAETDEVVSIASDVVTIKNLQEGTIKKVLTEDYLVKDFRNRLSSLLTEEKAKDLRKKYNKRQKRVAKLNKTLNKETITMNNLENKIIEAEAKED